MPLLWTRQSLTRLCVPPLPHDLLHSVHSDQSVSKGHEEELHETTSSGSPVQRDLSLITQSLGLQKSGYVTNNSDKFEI
jgi:hypothetical protein